MTQTPPTIGTLYERLGGSEQIRAIADDIVSAHLENPLLAERFQQYDAGQMRNLAFEFLAAGSGGPETYTGRELPEAHRGMGIDEAELVAVIDDILTVLNRHRVGAPEQQEVLAILWSLKDQVLHQ